MPPQPITDQTPIASGNGTTFTYLALGDSYTIGEAVAQAESFPYQLKKLLGQNQLTLSDPKIIATTGWTTDELQNGIKQAKLTSKYDVVTLLIGVNNQYRDYSIEVYKKEFSELLQEAIAFANGNSKHVFVISIPDWSVTPYAKGSTKSAATIAEEIDRFNAVNRQITLAAGVDYTDITPASRRAATEPELIAKDGLHPGAKMYAEWANLLLPKIVKVLK